MKRKGWPSTIAGVAQAYEDFLDVLVVDLDDQPTPIICVKAACTFFAPTPS